MPGKNETRKNNWSTLKTAKTIFIPDKKSIVVLLLAIIIFSCLALYYGSDKGSTLSSIKALNYTATTITITVRSSTIASTSSSPLPTLNATEVSTARSQLLSAYTMDAAEHATLILSLFVGLLTLVQTRDRLNKGLFMFLVALSLTFLEYLSLKFAYWSVLATVVLQATPVNVQGLPLYGLQQGATYFILIHQFYNLPPLAGALYYQATLNNNGLLFLSAVFLSLLYSIWVFQRFAPNS
jgi:hypothetical protein